MSIILIIYGIGAIVDIYDSWARGWGLGKIIIFAIIWPLTFLTSLYRKILR